MKRAIALFLCLIMCHSPFPAGAFAEEENTDAEAVDIMPLSEPTNHGEPEIEPIEKEPEIKPIEKEPAAITSIPEPPVYKKSEIELPEELSEEELTAASADGCGESLTWTLDDAGTLTISGTGDMTYFTTDSVAPWRPEAASVQTVKIGLGVTSIGSLAFSGCSNLTSVEIPDSVTSIGNYAFGECSSLTGIKFRTV